ncbi:MAG: YfhO family protein [Bacilli bacterium]|nr:YfhO family protein [Bacilli bacterium]
MKKIFKKNKIFWAFLSFSFLFLILSFGFNYYLGTNYIFNKINIDSFITNFIYFRSLLVNFFNTGDMSLFTYNVGLGTNLLPCFIYLFGDLLSYISVVFSEENLVVLFEVLIYIRLFLAGISFIIYCKYKNVSNYYSVIGAIIYSFSIFTLYFFSNNPYIFNLMIFLPLLTIGIEKIILDNKKIFFIIISFFTSLVNVYYIPLLLIYIILYSLVLIIDKYKSYGFKLIIMAFFRVLLSYLISLLLLSFILIPLLYQMFNSNISLGIFNEFSFVNMFFVSLVHDFNSTFIGINGIVLLVFPLVIKNFKENRLFIILLILFYILYGFKFLCFSNTSGFIILFILSYLISKSLDMINNITKSDFKWIISFVFINVLISFFFKLDLNSFMISLFSFFALLLVVLNKRELSNFLNRVNIYKFVFAGVLVFSVFLLFYNYDIEDNNVDSNTYSYSVDSFNKDFDYIKDDGIYRVNMSNDNTSNSTYTYKNKYYVELCDDLKINSSNFSNRTKINSLLNTKYYISNEVNKVPKYFDLVEEDIYLNNYFIELGSFYNSYILIDDYNSLTSIEKENSLLKYVALEKDDVLDKYLEREMDFKNEINKDINNISFSSNIDLSNNNILIDKDNKLILNINDNSFNGEVFLKIDNLKSKDKFNLKVSYNNITYEKEIDMKEDLLFNLSHFRDIKGSVYIEFSESGTYSFDSLELLVVNFNTYKNNDVPKLNSLNFKVLDKKDNLIKASVNSKKKGILQFSINYSDDFKVFIDNKEVDTYKVNKYFLGIYLDEGEHLIEVKYDMNGTGLGLCLSGIGLLGFLGIIIFDIKNKNKK